MANGKATEAKDEIKRMRKEAGMTQKAFSEFFDIPVRTLQDWEAGEFVLIWRLRESRGM